MDDDFEPASVHLDAALVPREGGSVAKTLRTVATIASGLMTGDLESGPSEIDLVVVRRATGGEVLRVSAGTVSEADRLLLRVRRDLDTKSVLEFVSEWRTEPGAPPGPPAPDGPPGPPASDEPPSPPASGEGRD